MSPNTPPQAEENMVDITSLERKYPKAKGSKGFVKISASWCSLSINNNFIKSLTNFSRTR
jgi:hypothetical protein